jgi:putative ABC transport system permease protein
MQALRKGLRPLLTHWNRRRRERELADELRLHLDLQTEANLRAGMPPKEARLAAKRQFGHLEGIKEQVRDGWSWGWLETVLRDTRTSVRSLRRTPGFAGIVIFTLALGVGANTAVFTVLHAVLFRPLAIADESRLLVLREFERNQPHSSTGVSYLNFTDWRKQARSFSSMAIVGGTSVAVARQGDATQAPAALVSHEFLEVLGVRPVIGRTFTASEDEGVASGVLPVLLSYSNWQARFGGAGDVLGQRVLIDEQPHEIVGVTPEGLFPIEDEPVDYWLTVAKNGASSVAGTANGSRGYRTYPAVIARLRDGVTTEQARAELESLESALKATHPTLSRELATEVSPLRDLLVRDFRLQLWLLFGMVATVLAIACVNVSNLLLARATTRQRELAIRAALGAGPWAIMRQTLLESMLFAAAGSAVGILLSVWFLAAARALLPADLPRLSHLSPDGPVLLFAVAVAGLTGLLCGAGPALAALRADPPDVLKNGGRAGTEAGWPERLRSVLVVGQVSLALILLVAAGLLLRSLAQLQRVRPGFDHQQILTAQVSVTAQRYASPDFHPGKINRLLEEINGRLSRLPGVSAVSHAQCVPLTSIDNNTRFSITERPRAPGRSVSAQLRFVGAGYFDLLRIPLKQGRTLTATDGPETPPVALVNEAFVRTFLAGENPLGLHLKLGWGGSEPKQIIGVVADVRHRSLSDLPRPEVYVPQSQFANAGITLLVRTQGDAASLGASLRRELQAIDPELPVTMVKTLESYREDALALPRFAAFLIGILSGLALLLTIVGLFGVMSYHVSRRTQEVGIRRALGASAQDVLRLTTGHGMRLVGIGIFVGLIGSVVGARLLRSQLYEISPTDPLTFGLIALLLAGVALLACLLPALRALRVDPAIALRCD